MARSRARAEAPPPPSTAAVRLPARAPLPRRLSGWLLLVWNTVRRGPWVSAGVLVACVFSGGVAHFAMRSEYVALREVKVLGATRTPLAQIEAIVRREGPDAPLVSLASPEEIEAAIDRLPTVRASRVVRRWPDVIEVAVVEREPRAVLLHRTGAFLVGDAGMVLQQASATDIRSSEGPLLTGFEGAAPTPGKALPGDGWTRALMARETIRRASTGIYRELAELHWDDKVGLTLVLRNGARVLVGKRPIAEAGPALETFAAADGLKTRNVQRVDLRAPTHLAWSAWPPPEPPRKTKKKPDPAPPSP
jgi:cell division septal protein FtsQ